jgi:hypothetical protein
MTAARRGPSRFTVWRRVLWRPFAAVLLGSYSVLAFLNWLKSEFLPAWLQAKLQLISLIAILADVPWHWWVIGFLLLLLGVILEGSYQAVFALEPDRDVTAVARCRAEGVQLFARRVTTSTEMDRWQRDYDAWYETAKGSLAGFPEVTRLKFEHLGSLSAASHIGAFDSKHNHALLILNRQLQILQEIAEGR